MNARKTRAWTLAALLCAGPAFAHHSIGMIDIAAPVWLKATVIRYEPRNPHVLIHVEETRADGTVKPWTIEGPIMARLGRMNLARDFLKPGDVIEICGFPFRKPGPPELPALHAQVLVLPDGTRQPWGPYGKLDNCVRPHDDARTWADWVNAVPTAREYWCKGLLHAGVPSVAPKAFVEDVNRRLASPCQ